ncbi:hypothetical protein PFISCL1PPCAC_17399, partial [Pristionchus fissidentatus]
MRALLLNIVRNVRPRSLHFAHSLVHRPFLEAHWDTWRVVEDYLRLEEYKNYTISFTGHSLGGALASLAAVRSANMGLRSADKLRLYTFGEPRVGKVDLARKIDELVPE